MINSIYFKWFLKSLTDEQLKDFQDRSINQQKDWYINYLESCYQAAKKTNK